MAVERFDQAVVTTLETRHDIVKGQLDLLVAERQETPHHGGRSRFLLVEALLPRNEQSGDHPGRVCGEAKAAPAHRCHDETVSNARATCIVARRARVDSVP